MSSYLIGRKFVVQDRPIMGYATYVRPEDGAVVSLPGHEVIGAPAWTGQVLAEIHRRLDWAGIPREGEWDWPEVPECAR